MSNHAQSTHHDSATATDNWLEVVREKVGRLHFGAVHVTVHDGRVTQVESVERTRFPLQRKSKG